MAPFAEVPEAAEALAGLLLDTEDMAVIRQTAEALARLGTETARRLIADAMAKADDTQADWLQTGIDDTLTDPDGPDLVRPAR